MRLRWPVCARGMGGGGVVATADQEWSRRIDLHMQSARELRIAACYHRAFKGSSDRRPPAASRSATATTSTAEGGGRLQRSRELMDSCTNEMNEVSIQYIETFLPVSVIRFISATPTATEYCRATVRPTRNAVLTSVSLNSIIRNSRAVRMNE